MLALTVPIPDADSPRLYRPPDTSTRARPGSAAKIAALAGRVAAGLPLFHPDDARGVAGSAAPAAPQRTPQLRHHKHKRLAYVIDPLTHQQVYLGRWGTRWTQEEYRRWLAALKERQLAGLAQEPPRRPSKWEKDPRDRYIGQPGAGRTRYRVRVWCSRLCSQAGKRHAQIYIGCFKTEAAARAARERARRILEGT